MSHPELNALSGDPPDWELVSNVGFMRMLLDGALKDANLWCSATGASAETKGRWAARAAAIRNLLDQLPVPVNPRDPFDDIPGEPTPEEADARWRERAAAEDARRQAGVFLPGDPTPDVRSHPDDPSPIFPAADADINLLDDILG